MDKLQSMFEMRESFMRSLKDRNPEIYPEWPVDLTDKVSQQHLRDTALKGVEEMFEALQHLKNWKSHKKKGDSSFDREEFLEEMVDAFNYFMAMFIMLGVTPEEFFDAYLAKNEKIHDRLRGNY